MRPPARRPYASARLRKVSRSSVYTGRLQSLPAGRPGPGLDSPTLSSANPSNETPGSLRRPPATVPAGWAAKFARLANHKRGTSSESSADGSTSAQSHHSQYASKPATGSSCDLRKDNWCSGGSVAMWSSHTSIGKYATDAPATTSMKAQEAVSFRPLVDGPHSWPGPLPRRRGLRHLLVEILGRPDSPAPRLYPTSPADFVACRRTLRQRTPEAGASSSGALGVASAVVGYERNRCRVKLSRGGPRRRPAAPTLPCHSSSATTRLAACGSSTSATSSPTMPATTNSRPTTWVSPQNSGPASGRP